jgi:hypothetical protein
VFLLSKHIEDIPSYVFHAVVSPSNVISGSSTWKILKRWGSAVALVSNCNPFAAATLLLVLCKGSRLLVLWYIYWLVPVPEVTVGYRYITVVVLLLVLVLRSTGTSTTSTSSTSTTIVLLVRLYRAASSRRTHGPFTTADANVVKTENRLPVVVLVLY